MYEESLFESRTTGKLNIKENTIQTWFAVYLPMLSVTQTNYSSHLAEQTEENLDKPQNSQCPGQV
jgi:hypothetical protein